MAESKDRYKYFRIEASELLEGLSQDVLELERGGPGKDLVGRILRLAHTLKGASRVVKQPEIAELAHAIEDIFAPYRERPDAVPAERLNQALVLLDTIAGKIASLDLPVQAARAEVPRPVAEELFETVRVEIAETDKLLDGVSEAAIQLTALRREIGSIEGVRQLAGNVRECFGLGSASAVAKARALTEELCNHLEHLERGVAAKTGQVAAELAQVRDAANRLRLLPAKTVFAALERSIRDAAHALQKEVVFESFGGDVRLDAHVLTAIRDALLHVVRNAAAPGIEPPGERVASGKPAQGRVQWGGERRANRAPFSCRDDGQGSDWET